MEKVQGEVLDSPVRRESRVEEKKDIEFNLYFDKLTRYKTELSELMELFESLSKILTANVQFTDMNTDTDTLLNLSAHITSGKEYTKLYLNWNTN